MPEEEREESIVYARPPPRFSIPISVDENVFGEDIMAIGERMDGLGEEDGDGLLDPFLFGVNVYGSEASCEAEVEEVDLFPFSLRSARTISRSRSRPSPSRSPSFSHSSAPSTASNDIDTLDAESFYSYTTFPLSSRLPYTSLRA